MFRIAFEKYNFYVKKRFVLAILEFFFFLNKKKLLKFFYQIVQLLYGTILFEFSNAILNRSLIMQKTSF
jgi:hypothetical protein